jgi:tape measure domain-containing protein
MNSPGFKLAITADGAQFFQMMQNVANTLRTFANQGQGVANSMQPAQAALRGFSGEAVKAASIIGVLRSAVDSLKSTLGDLVQTNLRLGAAQRGLQFATGDGAGSMAWIRQVSKELGLDLVVASEGFKLLAASTRESRLEGAPTRDIFKAVASAATVMGLDAEKTHSVLLALSQMVSKGRVQAEEMRKQLGEHLPGALNIAARAMGVTTAELGKMMEAGTLLADDFLPKFARQLNLELGESTAEASRSAQANFNRMKTAWDSLLFALGQSGFMREASKAAGEFSTSLNKAVDGGSVQTFGQSLGRIAGALKDAAIWILEHRRGLTALAAAYGAFKLGQWVSGVLTPAIRMIANHTAALAISSAWTRAHADAEVRATAATLGHLTAARAKTSMMLSSGQGETVAMALEIQHTAATEAHTLALQRQAAAYQATGTAANTLTTAHRAGGAIFGAMGGWIGIITTALMMGVSAWAMWGGSAKTAGDVLIESARKAETARQAFGSLTQDVVSLNKTLEDSKVKTESKKRAQDELNTVIKQMLLVYPDLVKYIGKEGESYSLTLDSLKKFTEQKKLDAQASVKQAEATILAVEADEKRYRLQAEDEMRRAGKSRNDEIAMGAVGQSHKFLARSSARKAELDGLKESLKEYLATLQKWQEQSDRLNAPEKTFKPIDTGKGAKGKDNIFEQELLRLKEQSLRFATQETLAQKQKNELDKIDLDLAQEKLRLSKAAKEGHLTGPELAKLTTLAEEQAGEARLFVEDKYNKEAAKLRADLAVQMEAMEEGGLAKRMKAIKTEFDQIRAEAKKLGIDLTAAIDGAEAAATSRARFDQVQADLSKLKKELAELAQIKGGALSLEEMEEAMRRFGAQSLTAAEAVGKFRTEQHLGEGGWAGMLAGVKNFTTQSQNRFQLWKDATTQMLQGIEGAFSSFFQSIFEKGKTGAQKWDALWKGMANVVMKALSDMLAKELMVILTRDTAHKSSATKAVATNAVETESNLVAGTSGFFKAYSGIPWWGVALALAGIAIMMSTVKARAVGGLVSSPELTLLGEAGPEVVAPESDFKDWAAGFTNLGANIAARQASADHYTHQASEYARGYAAQVRMNQASGETNGPSAPSVDLRGAHIFTNDDVAMGRFLRGMANNLDRLSG